MSVLERMKGMLARAPNVRLPAGLEIIVPVCNAERWIGVILDAYDGMGLRPLFILDTRSADRTAEILAVRRARVLPATGRHARVESLLYGVVPRLRSRWLLRLDDDELPSHALLAWVAGNLRALPTSVAGFPRQWVRCLDAGGWATSFCAGASRAAGGTADEDRQHRLFRRDAVTLRDDLHTPGFDLPEVTEAPSDAVIYHFDWLVRCRDERLRKIAAYDRQSPGNGTRFAAYYLPEDHEPSLYDFTPLGDPVVRTLASRMQQTNP